MRTRKINWNKVMAWFIVAIMVLSVLGIVGSSFFSGGERAEYNGFDLVKVNNLWLLKEGGKKGEEGGNDYYFRYLPSELENLSSPGEVKVEGGRLYFGFQPDDRINFDKAIGSLAYFFYNQGVSSQKACITEKDCPDIPIINCEEKPGIVIISGEKNGYTQDEKCLIMTAADNEELEKLTERLLYKLLGVMG